MGNCISPPLCAEGGSGVSVGVAVGGSVGASVGVSVGVAVGGSVGVSVGVAVGCSVGATVCSIVSVPNDSSVGTAVVVTVVPCDTSRNSRSHSWGVAQPLSVSIRTMQIVINAIFFMMFFPL